MTMFKYYKDLEDVVSLLVYSQSERSFLLEKQSTGEYWIPSSKVEKHCWKTTAHNIYYEQSLRSRLGWFTTVDLERQRAHSALKSPELFMLTLMAIGDQAKDIGMEFDANMMVEICEESVMISTDAGAGAVALAAPSLQLIQAAKYTKADQIRIYQEFLTLTFPAIYMSPQVFTIFMTDIGWQRTQCSNLFRAADITGRGGLSFQELLLWCAATEPSTQHGGVAAEIRCRYIFRYFDSNRDLKLEYVEFKELVAAVRSARQLPVDALSVAKDADVCLRQLSIQPNSQLPLAEFLRAVGELRLRGTSSILRAPQSISAYLLEVHDIYNEREREQAQGGTKTSKGNIEATTALAPVSSSQGSGNALRRPGQHQDYSVAKFTVRLRKDFFNELMDLHDFDEDTVSPSTARLITNQAGICNSMDVLGPRTCPVEAMAAVHYFATSIERSSNRRVSLSASSSILNKAAWSWSAASEEIAMGNLLVNLAEAVYPIIAKEPRLIRMNSPVYIIGDLHGNLNALLAVEAALWPSGPALSPAKILFLGDFVDRGPHGSELMAYLLAAKLQRPNGIVLVRGNHETRDIQKMFTFFSECITKYGETEGNKIWSAINQVFDVLPLAAVVDEKVFCCHGGIPPPWVCPLITAIDKVPLPLPRPAEQSTIAWELMWNDPIKTNKMTATLALELTANEGFAANSKRGTGHVFDQMAIDRFLIANQLSHVVRAHELHQNGFMCQLRGRLISIFSSSHYCGGTNDSGAALLDGGKVRLIRIGDN